MRNSSYGKDSNNVKDKYSSLIDFYKNSFEADNTLNEVKVIENRSSALREELEKEREEEAEKRYKDEQEKMLERIEQEKDHSKIHIDERKKVESDEEEFMDYINNMENKIRMQFAERKAVKPKTKRKKTALKQKIAHHRRTNKTKNETQHSTEKKEEKPNISRANIGKKFAGDEEVISKEKLRKFSEIISKVKIEIHKMVVGQEATINAALLALICDGHALLEGVPGLAKSLLVETLSNVVKNTVYRRIQFVPDLLPADILGVNAYNPQTGQFYTVKGPIFANFILADEINRAPPKTQAAMLEAMQEKKVNISKQEFDLGKPFFVLATQNPLEQYGTYPLPEALIDRFLFKIMVYYPNKEEEYDIINQNTVIQTKAAFKRVNSILDADVIRDMQASVRKIYVSNEVKHYIVDLVNATRGNTNLHLKGLQYIRYGGSPRASIYLALGARAYALTQGRNYIVPDDIKQVAFEVLRHRMILNYEGKAIGITTDELIKELLAAVEAP